MIGFCIMMWFVSFVMLMVAISLRRGNITMIHGKVFDATEDKAGYGRQLGKPLLLISVGIFVSGTIACCLESDIAIIYAIAVLAAAAVIGGIWFALIQKQYKR